MKLTPRGGGGMKGAYVQPTRTYGMPTINTSFKKGPSRQLNVSITKPGKGTSGKGKGCH